MERVEDVDQHEEEGHQEGHSAGNDVGRNQKTCLNKKKMNNFKKNYLQYNNTTYYLKAQICFFRHFISFLIFIVKRLSRSFRLTQELQTNLKDG